MTRVYWFEEDEEKRRKHEASLLRWHEYDDLVWRRAGIERIRPRLDFSVKRTGVLMTTVYRPDVYTFAKVGNHGFNEHHKVKAAWLALVIRDDDKRIIELDATALHVEVNEPEPTT